MSGLGMIISLLFLKPQETNQTYKIIYGTIFVISFISTTLLIMISLFGRRIISNVRINNSNRSPWGDFISKNLKKELQDKIFCTCYGIFYFVGAFYIINTIIWYFLPKVEKKIWCRFAVWPFIIFIIDFLGILCFFLNDWLVDDKGNETYELAPLSMYHGISLVVYGITIIVYLIFSLSLLLIEILKLCFLRFLTPKVPETVKERVYTFGVLKEILMLNLLSIISFLIIYPGNCIIFGIFVADNWGEYLIKYKDSLSNLLKIIRQYDDLFMVIAPIVQFLLTIIIIKEYRENFICIITCGRFYNYNLEEDNNLWARKVINKRTWTTENNNI